MRWHHSRFANNQLKPTLAAAFEDESGRDAHLAGRVAATLLARADELLAKTPQIRKATVLADKLPPAD